MSIKSRYFTQFSIDRLTLNHYSTLRFEGSPFTREPTPGRGSPLPLPFAQVAELVDALASGASEQLARGGSSPLLGTIALQINWLGSEDPFLSLSGTPWAFSAESKQCAPRSVANQRQKKR